MTVSLVINGTTYEYPETGDTNWGPDATDWASAVTSGMLQKAGGLFTLLAEADFGASFGLKSLYYKSRTANVAAAGQIRLARADTISWRNQANGADLALSVNSSDALLFNGLPIGNIASVSDTNSIDLTLTGTALSADLRLSVAAADAGYTAVTNSIESDGLQSQIQNTAIAAAITYSDTNTIDLTMTSTTLTGDLKLSATGPDASFQEVDLEVESDGIRAQIADADIIAAIPIADTDTTGLLSDTDWDIFNGKQAAGSYITALTGDVTASGPGSVAATIANNAVTNAKMAQMATLTIKGNNTGGASDPLDLTVAQTNAILPAFTGDSGAGGVKGLVPAPAAGDAAASKFLSAGGTWVATPTAKSSPNDAQNYSLVPSVAAGALTIALKNQAGSDPSAGDAVTISFRDTTLSAGGYTPVSATAATSIVVSSGSTLGQTSAVAATIYVYALNNAGTLELALAGSPFDDNVTQTTTAEGGAGAADSALVLYSTTARTDKAIRLLGTMVNTQGTAGTWATAPAQVSPMTSKLFPFSEKKLYGWLSSGSTNTAIARFNSLAEDFGTAITRATSSTAGDSYTINERGVYAITQTNGDGAGATNIGISVNSNELTTNINLITPAHRMASQLVASTDSFGSVNWTGVLNPGDVVRAHNNASPSSPTFTNAVNFTIVQVAKLSF